MSQEASGSATSANGKPAHHLVLTGNTPEDLQTLAKAVNFINDCAGESHAELGEALGMLEARLFIVTKMVEAICKKVGIAQEDLPDPKELIIEYQEAKAAALREHEEAEARAQAEREAAMQEEAQPHELGLEDLDRIEEFGGNLG